MILKKQGMIFISFPVNQNRWSENAPKRVKFQKFSWLGEGHMTSPKTPSLRRLGPSGLVTVSSLNNFSLAQKNPF